MTGSALNLSPMTGSVQEPETNYPAGFRQLNVWREAKALAIDIYKMSRQGALRSDYGLRDQMRRAAVSVCSNIAEGDERGTNKDSVRFLYIAKGSLAELRAQLEIAEGIGYLSAEMVARIEQHCSKIGKMLGALIKVRTVKDGAGNG